MKILLVGAKFLHADGQTEMRQLLVAFYIITNAPNKGSQLW